MEIKVFDSWDEVMPYKGVWNDILMDIDSDIVFMTFEWLYMWWEYHGSANKLFILMLAEGDEAVGFCPLMKIPKRGYGEIRFIGGDEATYMGFIVREPYKQQAIEGILDYLVRLNGRFLIDVQGILKKFDDYIMVKRYLKEKEWSFLEASLETYYINIDGQDFDSYIKTRFGRGSINTMKRKDRRLKKLGEVSFKPFDSRQEDIDTIFDIHDKRWQRKIGSSKFSRGITREFFKGLALSKDLPFKTSVDTIDINNRVISFIYGFEYNGKYIFYRIGHDDDFAIFSPGEIVLREKIKDCFIGNLEIFDFGAGYEPYKAAWGTNKTEITNFIFPSDNRFSKLVYNIRRWKWEIRQSLRGRSGIYHFVKYRLGKIKFYFYPENTKRAVKVGFNWLKDKCRKALTFIYWVDDYYIMNKQLKTLHEGGYKTYRVEEASVENLNFLLDITHIESSNILRRFLKGDRCILVYTHQDIHCLWFDVSRIDIKAIGYSCQIDKKSAFIYDYYSSEKKEKINRHILYSALEYLRQQDYDKCYLVVRKKKHCLMSLLKDEGFKRFRRIQSIRRFGKSSYRDYKGNLE